MKNIIAILAVPSNNFLCGFYFKGIESLISVGRINKKHNFLLCKDHLTNKKTIGRKPYIPLWSHVLNNTTFYKRLPIPSTTLLIRESRDHLPGKISSFDYILPLQTIQW